VADYFNQNKEKLLCNNNIVENMNKQSEIQNANNEVIINDTTTKIPVTENAFKKPQELLYPDFPGVTMLAEMTEFDKLWMCLFTKLGKQL